MRCGDICQNESSMLKKMLFPTPLLSSCSVTRCGKILQLWQHFLNLCQMVEGLFCVWANFWTYFSSIVMCFWTAFSMLYMANIEKLSPSGHTVIMWIRKVNVWPCPLSHRAWTAWRFNFFKCGIPGLCFLYFLGRLKI